MKCLSIFLLTISCQIVYGQGKQAALRTIKYAGEYSMGNDIEKGRVGYITIYPETDSTVLFYVQLNRGAPSYNMGQLTDRLIVKNDTAYFYIKLDDSQTSCQLHFKFFNDHLVIAGVQGQDDCGYGAWVYTDGYYNRKSHEIIDNFIGLEGDTVYFKSIKY